MSPPPLLHRLRRRLVLGAASRSATASTAALRTVRAAEGEVLRRHAPRAATPRRAASRESESWTRARAGRERELDESESWMEERESRRSEAATARRAPAVRRVARASTPDAHEVPTINCEPAGRANSGGGVYGRSTKAVRASNHLRDTQNLTCMALSTADVDAARLRQQQVRPSLDVLSAPGTATAECGRKRCC